MSPASKSKSKDKKSGKGSSKASSSGYNPVSGTFHTLEAPPLSSTTTVHPNGRFKSIDETEDITAGFEYDSVSNAESWSGGSEDLKEKSSPPVPRPEPVPGADNDKREKMRLKNERKHQRQKERRAQELHDRCSGYLMSRKLESLAQQLVAMGFSQERATMALILNEGRVEDSIDYLVDAGEEDDKLSEKVDGGGGNLKLDISEELARIADMVLKYKTTKQEVERTVVSCEGDLDKAEETLKAHKEEPVAAPKPVETGDPPALANGKATLGINQNPPRVKELPTPAAIQQRRDEKEFNYTKAQVLLGSSMDTSNRNVQLLKKKPSPSKPEWPKPQQVALPADKRWPNNPSSISLTSPVPFPNPQYKQELRITPVTNELKNLQLGPVKEPVIVMQRPQQPKQTPPTSLGSSPPSPAMSWRPNPIEPLKPNGFTQAPAVSRSISPHTVVSSSNPLYTHHVPYQQFPQQQGINSHLRDSFGTTQVHNGGGGRGATSPPLAAASSLGLFSRSSTNTGLSASLSQADWSTCSSMQFDYTNVDWSLDRGSQSGLWSNVNYAAAGSNGSGGGAPRGSWGYGAGVRSNAVRPAIGSGYGRDGAAAGGGGEAAAGGGGGGAAGGGGLREWTSPFEEKDIFGLHRQFVSSPSL